MPKLSATARARKIKLILFDVDGVLTDGKIWIFPALAGSPASLIEAKGFHAHDGTAIVMARMAGIKTGIITKRISETVALRARDLKMDHICQGIQNKASVFAEILEKDRTTAAEAAFVGDDVIDLPPMRQCGLAIAVKNARPEVKAAAHWTTPHAGGDGAARDAIEFVLKAQGKWRTVVDGYITGRS